MDYAAVPNLPTMFFDQARRLGNRPFLWAKRDKVYEPISYAAAAGLVRRLAGGLLQLGLKPGDRVVLVAENRPEWAIADLAIMAIGAVTVPAYTTNTVDDHLYILDHAGAAAAIVSTERLAKRVIPAARSAEVCDTVISIEPPSDPHASGINLYGWDQVLAMGDEAGPAPRGGSGARPGRSARRPRPSTPWSTPRPGRPAPERRHGRAHRARSPGSARRRGRGPAPARRSRAGAR
ncbi:AMP-dependent synthetase and ligase [alpha proteobacterium BAL199]|jgi:long-chain acyl-CoA synthetase|nr:AMP-dependent synthetase and ligase [alpha proteobacterium BAL199]